MNKEKLYTKEELKLIINEAYLQGAKDFNKYVKDGGISTNSFNSFWEKAFNIDESKKEEIIIKLPPFDDIDDSGNYIGN